MSLLSPLSSSVMHELGIDSSNRQRKKAKYNRSDNGSTNAQGAVGLSAEQTASTNPQRKLSSREKRELEGLMRQQARRQGGSAKGARAGNGWGSQVSPLLKQAQLNAPSKYARNGRRIIRAFRLLQHGFSRGLYPLYNMHDPTAECHLWDWDSLPSPLNPRSFMNEKRATRKKLQLVNLMAVASATGYDGIHPATALSTGKRPVIVDFCSGSGHAGLMFAIAYPHCDIVLVESNYHAVLTARKRISESRLTNVSVFHGNMDDYNDPFDLGVALHACGPLTDRTLDKCLQHRAMFLAAPCCMGKMHNQPENVSMGSKFKFKNLEGQVDNGETVKKSIIIEYPRSKTYRSVLSEKDFGDLAQTSDYGEWDFSNENDKARNSRACKALVEYDRVEFAREHGYDAFLTKMTPRDCTPKSDIVVAYPHGTGRYTGKRTLVTSPAIDGLYFV